MNRAKTYLLLSCLTLITVLTDFLLSGSYAFFTDMESWSFLIYPYDGRGECSLSFSDGSTIHPAEEGETEKLQYTFSNPSGAIIQDLEIRLLLPDGSTQTKHEYGIEPMETRNTDFPITITHEMLEPSSTSSGGTGTRYREISCCSRVKSFCETTNSTPQTIQGIPQTVLLYVYRRGGDSL